METYVFHLKVEDRVMDKSSKRFGVVTKIIHPEYNDPDVEVRWDGGGIEDVNPRRLIKVIG
jgi:hypothetical protein